MHDIKWTQAEKKHARKLFDIGLQRELMAVISEFKEKAASATTPEQMWAVSDYLLRKRREVEEKYDFRYSQLLVVFGKLLRENWIEEEELQHFGEEKIAYIHHIAVL